MLAASYLRWQGILFCFGGTYGFAARRDAGQKTSRSAAVGLLLVILMLFVGVFVWRFRASRQAQAKLSVIAQAGLPTTPGEAQQYYESLQSKTDMEHWRNQSGLKINRWGSLLAKINAPSDLCYYLDHMQATIDAFGQPPSEGWRIAKSIELDDIANIWPTPMITPTIAPASQAAMNSACRNTFAADACRVSLAIEAYRIKRNRSRGGECVLMF